MHLVRLQSPVDLDALLMSPSHCLDLTNVSQVSELRAAGVEPFAYRFNRTHYTDELQVRGPCAVLDVGLAEVLSHKGAVLDVGLAEVLSHKGAVLDVGLAEVLLHEGPAHRACKAHLAEATHPSTLRLAGVAHPLCRSLAAVTPPQCSMHCSHPNTCKVPGWQRDASIWQLACLQQFWPACSSSGLLAAVLACLQQFWPACSSSGLLAAVLACLQQLRHAYSSWAQAKAGGLCAGGHDE